MSDRYDRAEHSGGLYFSWKNSGRASAQARGFTLFAAQICNEFARGWCTRPKFRGVARPRRKSAKKFCPATIRGGPTGKNQRTTNVLTVASSPKNANARVVARRSRIGMFFGSVKMMKSVVAAETAAAGRVANYRREGSRRRHCPQRFGGGRDSPAPHTHDCHAVNANDRGSKPGTASLISPTKPNPGDAQRKFSCGRRATRR